MTTGSSAAATARSCWSVSLAASGVRNSSITETTDGLDPANYAGHSLRAGFATQAFLNGAAEVSILRQTRHKSLNTLRKYIRERSLFRDNPATKLGL